LKSREQVPVEPEVPGPDITASPTPPDWLKPFDQSPQARAVAELDQRLKADSDLVARLMFAGYQGKDWDVVASRLVAYALRVLMAWIVDGSVALKCRLKGWNGPWDGRCRDRQVARDLATDVVVTALEKFRTEVLIPGKWQPERGASLSTFFIGQCLLRWANVYRSWRRQETTP
jgi:hypothetical protein